jgi:hypothetical protein
MFSSPVTAFGTARRRTVVRGVTLAVAVRVQVPSGVVSG